MTKVEMKIDGMMCSMCEAHINDVIRKTVPSARKVSSNHKKGISSFVTDDAVNRQALDEAIRNIGYEMLTYSEEPYEKKLFGLF